MKRDPRLESRRSKSADLLLAEENRCPDPDTAFDDKTLQVDGSGAPAVRSVRRALLEVTRGPDEGKRVEVQHRSLVVGSASTCDLPLTDSTVSRRHLELLQTDEGWDLSDLGSRNGTVVRGLKIKHVLLGPTEEIEVGLTRLRFAELSDRTEVPLSPRTAFGTVLGTSAAMREVFAVLERAARSDATVLLEGESGTGKDLTAESVHRASPRADGPFVVVDCGAVAPSLVGSELFGHCRGAFTGADRERAGAVEAAHGGTVFLDEIASLDLTLQPHLLRLLERREIKRLGENRFRPVDVRILAASNRDLEAEVRAGRFREDLFYRLSVIRVRLPPLRERREDILPLAQAFVRQLGGETDPGQVLTEQILALLYHHDWPGNVRELRNVIERLLVLPGFPGGLGPAPPAEPSWGLSPATVSQRSFSELRARFERSYLEVLLAACGGTVAEAAARSGIPRQTLYRMLHKAGLSR